MKKDVLTVSVVKFDDNYSVAKIVHQDCNIFERGEFNDRELKVSSQSIPDWNNFNQELFLRGKNEEKDNRPFIVPNEDVELLIDRLNKINEKYSNVNPFCKRVKKNQEYYYINSKLEVIEKPDECTVYDTILYDIQNYFIDINEAQACAGHLKKEVFRFREKWQKSKQKETEEDEL